MSKEKKQILKIDFKDDYYRRIAPMDIFIAVSVVLMCATVDLIIPAIIIGCWYAFATKNVLISPTSDKNNKFLVSGITWRDYCHRRYLTTFSQFSPKGPKEYLNDEDYSAHEKELREQAVKQHQAEQQAKKPHCPKCGSDNLEVLGQHKKGFSVGKAVGGAVLTGGVGSLAGFAGKKTKKVDVVCMNCGNKFQI